MAAATVTNRRQNQVTGARRAFAADTVAFANNGDTLTVPGMKRIEDVSFTPTTNASFGFTIAANVITLVASAGVTGLMNVTGI